MKLHKLFDNATRNTVMFFRSKFQWTNVVLHGIARTMRTQPNIAVPTRELSNQEDDPMSKLHTLCHQLVTNDCL